MARMRRHGNTSKCLSEKKTESGPMHIPSFPSDAGSENASTQQYNNIHSNTSEPSRKESVYTKDIRVSFQPLDKKMNKIPKSVRQEKSLGMYESQPESSQVRELAISHSSTHANKSQVNYIISLVISESKSCPHSNQQQLSATYLSNPQHRSNSKAIINHTNSTSRDAVPSTSNQGSRALMRTIRTTGQDVECSIDDDSKHCALQDNNNLVSKMSIEHSFISLPPIHLSSRPSMNIDNKSKKSEVMHPGHVLEERKSYCIRKESKTATESLSSKVPSTKVCTGERSVSKLNNPNNDNGNELAGDTNQQNENSNSHFPVEEAKSSAKSMKGSLPGCSQSRNEHKVNKESVVPSKKSAVETSKVSLQENGIVQERSQEDKTSSALIKTVVNKVPLEQSEHSLLPRKGERSMKTNPIANARISKTKECTLQNTSPNINRTENAANAPKQETFMNTQERIITNGQQNITNDMDNHCTVSSCVTTKIHAKQSTVRNQPTSISRDQLLPLAEVFDTKLTTIVSLLTSLLPNERKTKMSKKVISNQTKYFRIKQQGDKSSIKKAENLQTKPSFKAIHDTANVSSGEKNPLNLTNKVIDTNSAPEYNDKKREVLETSLVQQNVNCVEDKTKKYLHATPIAAQIAPKANPVRNTQSYHQNGRAVKLLERGKSALLQEFRMARAKRYKVVSKSKEVSVKNRENVNDESSSSIQEKYNRKDNYGSSKEAENIPRVSENLSNPENNEARMFPIVEENMVFTVTDTDKDKNIPCLASTKNTANLSTSLKKKQPIDFKNLSPNNQMRKGNVLVNAKNYSTVRKEISVQKPAEPAGKIGGHSSKKFLHNLGKPLNEVQISKGSNQSPITVRKEICAEDHFKSPGRSDSHNSKKLFHSLRKPLNEVQISKGTHESPTTVRKEISAEDHFKPLGRNDSHNSKKFLHSLRKPLNEVKISKGSHESPTTIRKFETNSITSSQGFEPISRGSITDGSQLDAFERNTLRSQEDLQANGSKENVVEKITNMLSDILQLKIFPGRRMECPSPDEEGKLIKMENNEESLCDTKTSKTKHSTNTDKLYQSSEMRNEQCDASKTPANISSAVQSNMRLVSDDKENENVLAKSASKKAKASAERSEMRCTNQQEINTEGLTLRNMTSKPEDSSSVDKHPQGASNSSETSVMKTDAVIQCPNNERLVDQLHRSISFRDKSIQFPSSLDIKNKNNTKSPEVFPAPQCTSTYLLEVEHHKESDVQRQLEMPNKFTLDGAEYKIALDKVDMTGAQVILKLEKVPERGLQKITPSLVATAKQEPGKITYVKLYENKGTLTDSDSEKAVSGHRLNFNRSYTSPRPELLYDNESKNRSKKTLKHRLESRTSAVKSENKWRLKSSKSMPNIYSILTAAGEFYESNYYFIQDSSKHSRNHYKDCHLHSRNRISGRVHARLKTSKSDQQVVNSFVKYTTIECSLPQSHRDTLSPLINSTRFENVTTSSKDKKGNVVATEIRHLEEDKLVVVHVVPEQIAKELKGEDLCRKKTKLLREKYGISTAANCHKCGKRKKLKGEKQNVFLLPRDSKEERDIRSKLDDLMNLGETHPSGIGFGSKERANHHHVGSDESSIFGIRFGNCLHNFLRLFVSETSKHK